ncbi:thiolase family protein [Streptosporangium sp. NPDC051022]|uniref:thiolase family protein n=1 Tax=Streptosporangium sp. NPDC051022 TaxID=3155752 RepID=UPI00341AA77D
MPHAAQATQYAIVGLGIVHGPQPGRTRRILAAEAARLAIVDAGLAREDIDGTMDFRGGAGPGSEPNYDDAFSRMLGLPTNVHLCLTRYSPSGPAIASAMGLLDRGIANYVCVAGSWDDWSKSRENRSNGNARSLYTVGREGYWGKPVGEARAVSNHVWLAARHMAEYGTTSAQFGAIAVQQRAWAAMNPRAATRHKPMTVEDHQNSPMIVDPYHLFDMCLVSDGAIAYIITTLDRARDLAKPPVVVKGVGCGEMVGQDWWDQTNYSQLPVRTARDQAFRQAGIELSDIDVAELYDCFTGEVLFQLEDYGWCAKGEGGSFAESGAIGPGGSIPVNTGGGLLSCYHLGALTPLAEGIEQVRGEAGERQVADCELALVSGHGLELVSPGMSSYHTTVVLGRDR